MVSMVLPEAQDEEEAAMDRRPVRVSLDLDPADYRALCLEWQRRRFDGERATFAGILREALRRSLAS